MKFQNVKVGDKLWSIQLGECKVKAISTDDAYPIACKNENGISLFYTIDGFFSTSDALPSLYHSKPEIIEPKRKVTKTVDVWVNIDSTCVITATNSEALVTGLKTQGYMTKGTLTYETEE